jgi:hypothetical protein
MVIWYVLPRFGFLHQEKSGNPDQNSQESLFLNKNARDRLIRLETFANWEIVVNNVGSFLNITEVVQFFVLCFSDVKLILTNMSWATLWAIFSQTHLITLPESDFSHVWTVDRTLLTVSFGMIMSCQYGHKFQECQGPLEKISRSQKFPSPGASAIKQWGTLNT